MLRLEADRMTCIQTKIEFITATVIVLMLVFVSPPAAV